MCASLHVPCRDSRPDAATIHLTLYVLVNCFICQLFVARPHDFYGRQNHRRSKYCLHGREVAVVHSEGK